MISSHFPCENREGLFLSGRRQPQPQREAYRCLPGWTRPPSHLTQPRRWESGIGKGDTFTDRVPDIGNAEGTKESGIGKGDNFTDRVLDTGNAGGTKESGSNGNVYKESELIF
uniref:Uncharacterized protein n=1 Tax=Physcomitrium patens TaxID=3218 RepID=A0A2K1KB48_PHYPA|nr:hypothetical protein PHYPA_010184 [Physcomitrium patens]